jgi:branched-chain amino acid transport system permease protein
MIPRARINDVAVLAGALVLPWILTGKYHWHLLVLAGIFVLMALGLDLILGYCGELSLGHAAFFGIGAYVTALATRELLLPFPADLALACVISGLFGLAIGYPSLRLKGPYFAMVTLGFAEILRLIALNWMSVTRGPMGLPDIPSPAVFGFVFDSGLRYYYLVLAMVIAATLITRHLLHSVLGYAFLATRENDELALAVGVSPFHCKVIAFCVGTMLTGAAGSVYARYVHFVDPSALSFFFTYTVAAMVIVGGQGSIRGTVIGAVAFTLLPEYLRVNETYRLPAFGLLVILSIIFMPEGINGLIERCRARLAGRHATA